MSDLRDLYQELVLDHGQRPRNFRRPARWSRHAEGLNPLCGDRITVFVDLDAERLAAEGDEFCVGEVRIHKLSGTETPALEPARKCCS